MRWTTGTVAGQTRHCAKLPDTRWAYVEQSSRHADLWRLRICRKPGQLVADFYALRPTAEQCMALAEQQGRRIA